jgi:hypothetical protein
MAKAATKKAAKPAQPAEVALRIVVEASQDTPTYYVNHAEIALGFHELAIWFARLPTKPSRDELAEATQSGEIVVEPEFQILIPPTMLQGMIEALQLTKTRYEATFGPIQKKSDDKAS